MVRRMDGGQDRTNHEQWICLSHCWRGCLMNELLCLVKDLSAACHRYAACQCLATRDEGNMTIESKARIG